MEARDDIGGGRVRRVATLCALGALSAGTSSCSLWRREAPAEVGRASWYGPGLHGNRTASGERYDQRELSAAHPSLPLGTRARVTNLHNGRSVVVRINDRGPFVDGRVIDLSYGAARALGMLATGTARVRVEPLGGEAPVVTGRAQSRRRRSRRRVQ